MARNAKYEPLADHLRQQGSGTINMTFDEIGALVGGLPMSARKFGQWWENSGHHVQAKAWLAAGFKVESADRQAGTIRFRRR